jgi:DNA gyrase subunit B
MSGGPELSGELLERRLEKLMLFRKLLQVVERRGPARRVVLALLEGEARDRTFWGNREAVEALAGHLQTPDVHATVVEDSEHQAFAVALEDRSAGYARRHRLDLDFVTTAEFRLLSSAYQDVRDLMAGSVTIRTGASSEPEPEDVDETAGEAAPAVTPVEDKKSREADREVTSLDELVEFFVAAGRRGISVNRYKGLGEMNPDTLWNTTMNPEKRTLLQVRAEDHTEADLMFTTLMGDQVEPRRKFIEDNALDVKNLDI